MLCHPDVGTYFEASCREVARVLKPNGSYIVISHFDPLESECAWLEQYALPALSTGTQQQQNSTSSTASSSLENLSSSNNLQKTQEQKTQSSHSTTNKRTRLNRQKNNINDDDEDALINNNNKNWRWEVTIHSSEEIEDAPYVCIITKRARYHLRTSTQQQSDEVIVKRVFH